MKDDKLLTTQQAAHFLGVRPNTLAVWRARGVHRIPYVRIGKMIRYKLSDLIEFQAEHHTAT